MLFETLYLFLVTYFIFSPIGLTGFIGHLSAVIILFFNLSQISKNILFFLLLTLSCFFASQSRLSIEYLLFASTCICIGMNKNWIELEEPRRRKILFILFLLLVLIDKLNLGLYEKGSLLLWLPVFISAYYEKINKKNYPVYLLFGVALFFLNKLSVLIAFILTLRSKILYFLSVFVFMGYFSFKHDFMNFILKSFEPRIYIWKSALNGFLSKPFFGFGFGTFPLDFPEFRFHAKVLGGKINEQVVHGHSLFFHYAFELGVTGLILLIILFYLVYKNIPEALLPLFAVSVFDSTLSSFNQIILASLILSPKITNYGIFKIKFLSNNKFILRITFVLALFLSSYINLKSLLGHYFYEKWDLDNAIKWDNSNSLYYFSRGAENLHLNSLKSEQDFKMAISLNKSIPYFYGFLGASQLANKKINDAKTSLEKAMSLDGKDGYWCLLYAYANHDNKKIFDEYISKAERKNPEIKDLLEHPDVSATKYIGKSKSGDIRIAGFYRGGKNIYYPLPVLDKELENTLPKNKSFNN